MAGGLGQSASQSAEDRPRATRHGIGPAATPIQTPPTATPTPAPHSTPGAAMQESPGSLGMDGGYASNVPAFLTKLWTLVEDPETNHLICWSAVSAGWSPPSCPWP
ncbi:hypothetical protein AGOR_G00168730 [Albula goreensis]|uniref:Uncharacterized protein n=1 Tax=Albula goreensis TaxID=1534307 RepID=A0A8T3CXE9_9TELE|nr:hypothetical protein AGOR_G00168730 [Albula goreensis]